MLDLLLSLGWGSVSLTREKAEELVENLVKRGDIKRDDAKKVFQELIERGEKEREEFKDYIGKEMNRLLERYNIVTRSEFEELKIRVSALEEKLQRTAREEGE